MKLTAWLLLAAFCALQGRATTVNSSEDPREENSEVAPELYGFVIRSTDLRSGWRRCNTMASIYCCPRKLRCCDGAYCCSERTKIGAVFC